MKYGKSLSIALALGAALVLGACAGQPAGGGSAASESQAASSAASTEGLAKIDFSGSNDPTTVKVTVKEGESLVVMGNLSAGEATVKTSQNGEWLMDDYLYEGYSVGSTDVSGEFEITFEPKGATGVAYALSYDASSIDFQNMESQQIFDEILKNVG